MIKKILLLAIIVTSISSCSTYNSFSKRKYYNFSSRSSNIKSNENSIESKENLALPPPIYTEKIVEKHTKEPSIKTKDASVKQDVLIKIQTSKITKNTTSSTYKKRIANIVKVVKHKHATSSASEKRPGRFWWLWAIDAFIGLILALFVSAYIGLILMVVGITLAVISLIRYIKSK